MHHLSLALLAVSLFVGACVGSDAGDQSVPLPPSNEADRQFLGAILAADTLALPLGQLAAERALHPDIRALAAELSENRESLVALERNTLRFIGPEPAPAEGGIPGSVTQADMAALEAASGLEAERLFLELLARHDEETLTLAEAELRDGVFPGAMDLAEQIITARQGELETARHLLALSG